MTTTKIDPDKLRQLASLLLETRRDLARDSGDRLALNKVTALVLDALYGDK